MLKIFSRLFDQNEKQIKALLPVVEKINEWGPSVQKLKDEELKAKTSEFRERLSCGETLEEILPESFAVVRETIKRTLGERAFDVQLTAGICLHHGKVAEQRTGEGKTHSAIFAAYLNALSGRGVHIVTVNDYLARRDVGWYGVALNNLGMSVSSIIQEKSFILDQNFIDENQNDPRLRHLKLCSRQEAYQADVTYGINSEFGFDYLRDNGARRPEDIVQRDFHFAIIDEVDSILIDEARTPHIISVPNTEVTQKYYDYARIVAGLTQKLDYLVEEKEHTAHLTDHGLAKVEKILGVDNLYEKDFGLVHHIEAALKARTLYIANRDYVVKDNEVIIVDEFTGRLQPGRRWSAGIHEAIEAKEGLKIQQESRTLATISLQNYFRMYEKLGGMTGTAATEAEEFNKIYKLEVVVIPTHQPMVRQDFNDVVYKSQRAKFGAIAREIEEKHKAGQPILVGTRSIEINELLSQLLKHKKISHEVLNAKNHLREAEIIANAGKKGAVTVATNMAGRGVDIILGGTMPKEKEAKEKWQNEHNEVVKLGGLHVIGTERHESRRIDNQLRGRSGRQGDQGSSRFFVALDDEIIRLFGGEQVSKMMTFFNMPEDIPLEHGMVSRAIEQSQTKVESFYFEQRKRVVDYDDIANKQREIVYKKRREALLNHINLRQEIKERISQRIENIVGVGIPEGYTTEEKQHIIEEFCAIIPLDEYSKQQLRNEIEKIGNYPASGDTEIKKLLYKIVEDLYQQRLEKLGPEVNLEIEKWVYLQVIDNLWIEHLEAMDDLREGIGLRSVGQRDPLMEFKAEAYDLFERLMVVIDSEIVHRIFRVQVSQSPIQQQQQVVPRQSAAAPLIAASGGGTVDRKLGRNDPCPCGSGKKYKKCCYPKFG